MTDNNTNLEDELFADDEPSKEELEIAKLKEDIARLNQAVEKQEEKDKQIKEFEERIKGLENKLSEKNKTPTPEFDSYDNFVEKINTTNPQANILKVDNEKERVKSLYASAKNGWENNNTAQVTSDCIVLEGLGEENEEINAILLEYYLKDNFSNEVLYRTTKYKEKFYQKDNSFQQKIASTKIPPYYYLRMYLYTFCENTPDDKPLYFTTAQSMINNFVKDFTSKDLPSKERALLLGNAGIYLHLIKYPYDASLLFKQALEYDPDNIYAKNNLIASQLNVELSNITNIENYVGNLKSRIKRRKTIKQPLENVIRLNRKNSQLRKKGPENFGKIIWENANLLTNVENTLTHWINHSENVETAKILNKTPIFTYQKPNMYF